MSEPMSRMPLRRQVLRSLLRRIAESGLGPEDRLPTERELAAELGVGRNTVREALKSLEAIGAVARRPKRGSVLKPVDFGLLADVSQTLMLRSASDYNELLAARRAFEMSVLSLATAHADEEDFRRMEAANRLIESEVGAGWLPVEGDLAFHEALLNASHNRFLVQFGRLLQAFFRTTRPRVAPEGATARRTLRDHRDLIRALRARSLRRAQQVMERHLNPPQAAEAPRGPGRQEG